MLVLGRIIIFTCFFAVFGALAQSGGLLEARLVARSTTGKTITVNLGTLDQLKTADPVVLLIDHGAGSSPRLQLVARGRVMRAGSNRSVIFLKDLHEPGALVTGQAYIVTTDDVLLRGRRKLDNSRGTWVDEKQDFPRFLKEKKNGEKDELAIRRQNYRVIQPNHPLQETFEKDGILYDLDEWVTVGAKAKQKHARALWRSPYTEAFAETKRMDAFEKNVDHLMAHADGEVSASRGVEDPEVVATRLERLQKGESWSADHSDEELRTIVQRVGDLEERERRMNARTLGRHWQAIGVFGVNILDNENRADAEDSRKTKWGAELMLEWYPAPTHRSLRALGLWIGARKVKDGVSVGSLNAQSSETSYSAGMDWHLWHSPNAVGANIPFLGVGLRSGTALLSIPSNHEEASYSVISLPVLIGGVKYNFTNGWGLRVAASMEKLVLDQTQNNVPDGKLPDRTRILDGRLSLGLTRFF